MVDFGGGSVHVADIVHTGKQCTIDGCCFISGEVSSAKAHARSHGWVQSKPPTWENKSVQVLQRD
jgi:hypothetical protein